jgi:hypothetical protein
MRYQAVISMIHRPIRHELAAIMVEGVSVVKIIDKIVRCFLAVGFLVPCLLELLYYLA